MVRCSQGHHTAEGDVVKRSTIIVDTMATDVIMIDMRKPFAAAQVCVEDHDWTTKDTLPSIPTVQVVDVTLDAIEDNELDDDQAITVRTIGVANMYFEDDLAACLDSDRRITIPVPK